jgi:hypothetical protein
MFHGNWANLSSSDDRIVAVTTEKPPLKLRLNGAPVMKIACDGRGLTRATRRAC